MEPLNKMFFEKKPDQNSPPKKLWPLKVRGHFTICDCIKGEGHENMIYLCNRINVFLYIVYNDRHWLNCNWVEKLIQF